MKKIIKLPLAALCALCLMLACLFIFSGGGTRTAYAASNPYSFEFRAYSVTYDINSDLTMSVKEDLTILFTGSHSTGFIRDIPVNAGDRVRNVRVSQIENGNTVAVDYSVNNEYSDFISVDIGDTSNKTGDTFRYLIEYDYAITKPKDANTLYLNAVGFGSEAAIHNLSVTLRLPDGFTGADCYAGASGTDKTDNSFTVNGNVLTYQKDALSAYNGVTFALHFGDGVLSTKADITPYWLIIVGCVLIAALVAVKFLKFTQGEVLVVPNFDAKDKFDPLIMGKLIDNKAAGSDVTSLIYYWANKGYLKINLADEDDIELIRIVTTLPDGSPDYQQVMYANLFARGDSVRINSLKNVFYPTVEKVTRRVNFAVGNISDTKSTTISILFAILGGALMGLTPTLLAMFTINTSFIYLFSLLMFVPVIGIYLLARIVRDRSPKYGKGMVALMYVGVAILAAACTALYVLLVPSHIIETVPKIIICIVGFAIVMLSVTIVCRTEEYEKKLGLILGFKDFITNVEKDKLELMFKDNPEMYYEILPYAQVLGVSDIWENKFKDLTVAPPQWATGYNGPTLFDYVVFCAVLNRLSSNMSTTFVSRPAPKSSGASGGGRGHFGGFGGGGHGGGGFRGR